LARVHTLRTTKLQFSDNFWSPGYGLHTPAVINKVAMVLL